MTQKMNLDVKTIENKKFNIDYKGKGYNAGEVDEFLELLKEDFRVYQTITSDLQRENNALKTKLTELEAKLHEKESEFASFLTKTLSADVLERISHLEEEVHEIKVHNIGTQDDGLPEKAEKSSD